MSVFVYGPNVKSKSVISNAVIWRKTDYKVTISLNEDADFDNNILEREVVSLVMDVNEVTHKRYISILAKLEESTLDLNNPSFSVIRTLLCGQDPMTKNSALNQKFVVDNSEKFESTLNNPGLN